MNDFGVKCSTVGAVAERVHTPAQRRQSRRPERPQQNWATETCTDEDQSDRHRRYGDVAALRARQNRGDDRGRHRRRVGSALQRRRRSSALMQRRGFVFFCGSLVLHRSCLPLVAEGPSKGLFARWLGFADVGVPRLSQRQIR